ncbi:MAG: MtrB/PioB family decaheme-associated outer membrane protein [Aeromonas sp.]
MKYSTLWLSLLAAFSAQAAESQAVTSYALTGAQEAKTARWSCNECQQPTGWSGDVTLGAGYSNGEDTTRFQNWVPAHHNAGLMGSLSADLDLQGEGSRYGKVKVDNLGLARFSLATEQGYYDGLRVKLGYRESPFYWTDKALSIYPAADNPHVEGDALARFEKETLRKTLTGAVAYTSKSPWRPYAEFSYQKKEATLGIYRPSIPGVGYLPGFLPKPIDDATTTLVKSGVSYLGEGWLVDLGYQGSLYRNNETALYFGKSGYENAMAYEPDNDFHQLSLSGQYQWGMHHFSGRVLSSRATSEVSFAAFPNTPVLQNGFDGEINTFHADAKWLARIDRDLTLRANLEHRDRQDDSDRYALIGKVREAQNRTRQKAGVAADYRVSRALKMSGGYDYRADQREGGVDRRDTDEHIFYVKGRYRPAGDWQVGAKASYSERGGSDWQNDVAGEPTLRQYYLASRDRTELRGDLAYQVSENLNAQFEAWWAHDNYREGNIGRSEASDKGIDLSLHQQLGEHFTANLFTNYQWIDSKQAHANHKQPGWAPYHTEVKDAILTIGTGLSHKGAFDLPLVLGLDYSFAYGRGENNTSAGVEYSDVTSKQHRLEGHATYQLTPAHAVRWDLGFESYQDADFLWDGQSDNLGDLAQDYAGYYTGLSWRYSF